MFIPFNVLCKSTTVVGRQILRSGFDPETHSKGPPNSRITYEPLYASSDEQQIFQAGAQSTLLRTLLANINRPVAYVKPLSKKPVGYSKRWQRSSLERKTSLCSHSSSSSPSIYPPPLGSQTPTDLSYRSFLRS